MEPTHSTFAARPNRDALDRALLGLVDAGLAAVVLVAPFFMGGRQALGQLVLVALAWFVATAWLLIKGGENVGATLGLLGNYLPGYAVTWPGAVVGRLYGAAIGAAMGWTLARVYNRLARRR